MSFKVVNLTCDPNPQKAGAAFRLTLELDTPAESDVEVGLEKQRLVWGGSFPVLRPTGADYFDLDPKPIVVKSGSRVGTSEPIKVKRNPMANQGEPPVVFPEQLVFSAFDTEIPGEPRFRSVLVTILGFGAIPR